MRTIASTCDLVTWSMSSNLQLTEDSVAKKLQSVVNTRDSIQSLALWILHHKSNHKKIVDIWLKTLKNNAEQERKLTLFYLCNDVIQTCKKKHAAVYLDSFREVLPESIISIRGTDIISSVIRILNIWSERAIYDSSFVNELHELINEHVKKNKLPEEFKPSHVTENVQSLKNLQSQVTQKISQLSTLRLDISKADALSQLKDKAHGKDFASQFESSCVKLDDGLQCLTSVIRERRKILGLLEGAIDYYEEQYSDANVVANAYKAFGNKLNNMHKKIQDLKASLPDPLSPLPSPNADAPSPGSTPPPISQCFDNTTSIDMDIDSDEMDAADHPKKGHRKEANPAVSVLAQSFHNSTPLVTSASSVFSDKTTTSSAAVSESSALERRIANMLPNIQLGLTSTEPEPDVSNHRSDNKPSRSSVCEESAKKNVSDDGGSTPVQDEAPSREAPFDMLSRLINKTQHPPASAGPMTCFLETANTSSVVTKWLTKSPSQPETMSDRNYATNWNAPYSNKEVEHSTGEIMTTDAAYYNQGINTKQYVRGSNYDSNPATESSILSIVGSQQTFLRSNEAGDWPYSMPGMQNQPIAYGQQAGDLSGNTMHSHTWPYQSENISLSPTSLLPVNNEGKNLHQYPQPLRPPNNIPMLTPSANRLLNPNQPALLPSNQLHLLPSNMPPLLSANPPSHIPLGQQTLLQSNQSPLSSTTNLPTILSPPPSVQPIINIDPSSANVQAPTSLALSAEKHPLQSPEVVNYWHGSDPAKSNFSGGHVNLSRYEKQPEESPWYNHKYDQRGNSDRYITTRHQSTYDFESRHDNLPDRKASLSSQKVGYRPPASSGELVAEAQMEFIEKLKRKTSSGEANDHVSSLEKILSRTKGVLNKMHAAVPKDKESPSPASEPTKLQQSNIARTPAQASPNTVPPYHATIRDSRRDFTASVNKLGHYDNKDTLQNFEQHYHGDSFPGLHQKHQSPYHARSAPYLSGRNNPSRRGTDSRWRF